MLGLLDKSQHIFLLHILISQMIINLQFVFDRDNREIPVVILICREFVLRIRLCSPAVVSGNTHHPVVHAYFHEIPGIDVVDMCLFGFTIFGFVRIERLVFREILPLIRPVGFFRIKILNPITGNVELHEVRVGNK